MNNLGSGSAPAAQSTGGDQSGAATPAPDAGVAATSGAPVQTGDANTDYNAAIALVQDKSRQMTRLKHSRTSSKSTRTLLTCPMRITGWVS